MSTYNESVSVNLLDNAPFGYLKIDHTGTLLNMNNTLRGWLGFGNEKNGENGHINDLLTMGGKIYFQTHFLPMLQVEGEVSEVSLTMVGQNKLRLPVLVNARKEIVEAGSWPAYSMYIIDITRRKMYESELLKERKKAESMARKLAQINNDLEHFANVASHDLQSPLRTIQGLISLIEKKQIIEPDSEAEKLFSMIKSNADQMKLMIKDLLVNSQFDEPDSEYELVSLKEVCREAIGLIKFDVDQSKASINISNMPVVLGSRPQLVRLFQNLFENSIKYKSEANPVISVEGSSCDEYILVSLKDNGIGFAEEYAEEIFSFMKRLHSSGDIPGTGIGLTSCKRIMENHGGSIRAESKPNEGALFELRFPKHAALS
ncbi:MAG: PAS domain-containing sensor histidine kinase, partial [Balneolia bacterium]|nr:PAS domain-containing sensor histidine kinase [Balneolia bacterium]